MVAPEGATFVYTDGACSGNPGPGGWAWAIDRDHLAYKITSGDDDVWSSSHCPAQVPDDPIVLRSATPAVYRMAWTGRTSTRDCPPGADFAEPGEYAVQAAAIGGEPSGGWPG